MVTIMYTKETIITTQNSIKLRLLNLVVFYQKAQIKLNLKGQQSAVVSASAL